jgi:hypothetical protein
MVDKEYTNWLAHVMDAFSLSGAIILIFAGLTSYGIFMNQEKVWTTFGTALTTFVSGKKIESFERDQKASKLD